MARDTYEAFCKLGLKDIHLFGASQGGMIAMIITIEHPELVKKVVFGSTSATVHADKSPHIHKWSALAKQKNGTALMLSFAEYVYPAKFFEQYKQSLIVAGESIKAEDFERFIRLANSANDFNILEKLKTIHCPVLVIGSKDDRLLPANAPLEIAEVLKTNPSFRMHMYEDYGHACFDTAPDFKERILEFFNEDKTAI